jgi:similar to stage IV sporulation protein
MAASRGIFLWDIKRVGENELYVKTRLSAVKPLRHIGRSTGSLFKFKGREGLPFMISRLKRRKSLILGAVLFLISLYALSSFIWFIDIKGNKVLPTEKVLQIAAEGGLKTGVLRFRVDGQKVEGYIKERMPEVYYVSVEINGTRATIEVAEKTIQRKEEQHPANIVAKKAGLVKEVLVLMGNPLVKEGDTVVPGQTLISGIIPSSEFPGIPPGDGIQDPGAPPSPPPLPTAYVRAAGLVRARVWYEGYGEIPLVEEGIRETGNRISRVCIKIGGREIILKGSRSIPYADYKLSRDVKKAPGWRNLSIPVEIITEEYVETEKYRVSRSRGEALELARSRALESACADIKDGVQIIEKKTGEVTVKTPENIVRMRAYVETLEDIGMEKPIERQ